MRNKMNIMDLKIDTCTAKEAMKVAIESIDSVPVSIFEIVTGDTLLQLASSPELKDGIAEFDVMLAGETALLEAAGITEKKYLQETKNKVFLKMFMRYLNKQHKKVYLLAETEEEIVNFQGYMKRCYSGAQIVGTMKVSAENKTDDMIVNAINGSEAECVLSVLSTPLQEELIVKNRKLLSAHIWMALGKENLPVCKSRKRQNWLTQFIMKCILKKEIEKEKKKGGN